ncbi:MAG: helix-turn-helix transcriptional regulator [Clostridia bacterium]|nr:helix-turn-helix transcriptional regulator [Clostridia bacterium]
MLYQTQHSVRADNVTLETGANLNFPTHIHSSFEIIVATEGEMEITISGNQYALNKGECVLIFPNQIHEIKTEKSSQHMLCIFSPQLVRAYSKTFETKIPRSHKFNLDKFYIDKLSRIDNNKSTIELKGLLYSICAEFDKNAEYIEFNGDKKNLLFKIFKFVEDNFKGECSLYDLAKETTYNYVYLSKHFSKNTGITYTEYVNRYRVNEASYLLMNTNRTMLDIAYECGFDCLRSFNRSFKNVMGMSPSEYKNQKVKREYK